MLGRAKARMIRPGALRRSHLIEQSEFEFDCQNAANGIVNPVNTNHASSDVPLHLFDEFLPVDRDHEHIDSGVDTHGDGFAKVVGQVIYAVPIRNYEAAEFELALEYIG